MKASDTVAFRDDPRSFLARLRARLQPRPDVIDFEAIKAVRARSLPGDTLVDASATATRAMIRALAWAKRAEEADRASVYRRAARRVADIYMRECRHPSLVLLARALQERAVSLKGQRHA